MKTLDDNRLWKLTVSGDQKAFDELFKRYFHRLCEFADQFRLSPGMVEEVVSDVFINLWLKRHDLFVHQIKAYLYASTKNLAINRMDKKSQMIQLEDAVGEDFFSDADADRDLMVNDLRAKVDYWMNRLTPQQRHIFLLSRLEGFKTHEIADILSISPKTVSNSLTEASKFISKYYQQALLFLILLIFK